MPLPGPMSPQVSRFGRDVVVVLAGDRQDRGACQESVPGAVRDDHHPAGVGAVPLDQPPRRGLDRTDHGVAEFADAAQDRALPAGGRAQHGVQHGDDRHPYPVQHFQHLRAVRPAVDAVLVLDDRHVEAAQRRRDRRGRLGVAVRQLGHDLRRDRKRPFTADHLHDRGGRPGPGLIQVPHQRGAERRDAALRGRIGAEHSKIGHGSGLSRKGRSRCAAGGDVQQRAG